MRRKGIILAGGAGTRLYPMTEAISKQMAPVFDKPMIYYALSILFLAKIREILIISTPQHTEMYEAFLGDGSNFGVTIEYVIQEAPDGLAQAYILAENFLSGNPSALILGDNIFYGNNLTDMLKKSADINSKPTIFCAQVPDPQRFGVVELNERNEILSIEEKPKSPKSNYAVTGLYFMPSEAPEIAKSVSPSERGELEITSVLEHYVKSNMLKAQLLKRGFAWFDTGTHQSLLRASNFVETIQSQQRTMIACLEEIAFNNNWIDADQLYRIALRYQKSHYGQYLLGLI